MGDICNTNPVTNISEVCYPPYECCMDGARAYCCNDYGHHFYGFSFWNMWYFWFVLVMIMMICFASCGYIRRRRLMLAARQRQRPTRQTRIMDAGPGYPVYFAAYAPGTGPTATIQGPPAYTEVVSKPDLYPVNTLPPYSAPQGQGLPPATVPTNPPPYSVANETPSTNENTAPTDGRSPV